MYKKSSKYRQARILEEDLFFIIMIILFFFYSFVVQTITIFKRLLYRFLDFEFSSLIGHISSSNLRGKIYAKQNASNVV